MAPRPKIKYTNLGTGLAARAYRGDIANLRHELDKVYDGILEKKAGWKTAVAQTIREFSTQAAITLTTATQAVVSNAQTGIPLGDATAVANGQDNGTAAVAAGAITRITLPSTDKIIKSTVKYTGPAITGTYVNGYTFTIAAGQITAIVAS